jgi:hypothetical protein
MPAKNQPKEEIAEVFSQKKQPERGRYLLQVDRQTKGSYTTSEAARTAALAAKKTFSVLQVLVYDNVEHTYTMIESPAK